MSIHQFSATLMNGEDKSLKDYAGNVVLIVNTATECGFTPQLKALQELYETYKEAGFSVLGFPSNQFNEQNPGTNKETEEICQVNYGVTFPLFQEIAVKGKEAHPLFKYITEEKAGIMTEAIKWNFTKFLVDQSGRVVKRYAPITKPEKIKADIERLLKSNR